MGFYPFVPSSGGTGFEPWQFHVAPLGGAADDTPNLQAALTAASNYALNNQGYGEVVVDPALYTLSSATVKTSANKGNSQLWFPVVGTGVPAPTISIRCPSVSAPWVYFNQTVAQNAGGAIFNCTLTGQTVDGTFGVPSVIGGPTQSQGYGYPTGSLWDNITPQIDGINVLTPLNPTMCAYNFQGCANMRIIRATAGVNATHAQMASTAPSNNWTFGLLAPGTDNNDNVFIGELITSGYYYGSYLGEHANWQKIAAFFCFTGILLQTPTAGGHGFSGLYYTCEVCNNGIQCALSSDTPPLQPLFIGHMDCESIGFYASGYHIDDGGTAALTGYVGLTENSGSANIKINGNSNLQIIAMNQNRGFVTPPGIPLTTVALQNPFWRNANVYLTSGGAAVTAIAINGTSTGLTLGTSGTVSVKVPTGATITLTYSSTAPTWTWELE